MLIYLSWRMAVGFFASMSMVVVGLLSADLLMRGGHCEAAAKSSHCGKGGWTRLFAFAYTRQVRAGTHLPCAGQFENSTDIMCLKWPLIKYCLLWGILWIWSP